jgi:hypothetical protein
MSEVTRRSFLLTGGAAAAGAAMLAAPSARAATGVPRLRSAPSGGITVRAGQTYTVAATTRVAAVTIEQGGVLTAPDGYSLTMTVGGLETGQKLAATSGADTVFVPGNWHGDIVLTVTNADDVPWQQHVYPFRQAIYADAAGLVKDFSVLAAAVGGRVTNDGAVGVSVTSTGECFDGVFVNGGSYALERPSITLTGNGRCDFVGYGAALVANNAGTRLVVDGATVRNHGAVRTAAISDNGATLVVKNSFLSVANGVLPSDYVPTVNLDTMESAPWMLAIDGNCRATNLLGNNSIAAYLNSSISSQSWGVLSTDSGADCTLVAVNSRVANTGDSGYGTYVIGNATEYLLGTQFDVGSYATIFTGGTATYGDSDAETVAALNQSLGLGLTDRELRALTPRPTVVNSRQWGFMWHAPSSLAISGGTVVNSRHATYLNKGQQLSVTVDGGKGARLNPSDGILVQVIDNDDPGPVMVNGVLENAGVYTQPTGEPVKDTSFDVTVAHDTDSVFYFDRIKLDGDFYNGLRGGAASTSTSGPGGPGPASALNLVLNFAASKVTGVATATLTTHHVDTIDSSNWWELGHVTNVAQAAINNGVIVSLTDHSTWTVTGTSYLTSLSLDATSAVAGLHGKKLTLTVDGTQTPLTPNSSYAGAIVITVG